MPWHCSQIKCFSLGLRPNARSRSGSLASRQTFCCDGGRGAICRRSRFGRVNVDACLSFSHTERFVGEEKIALLSKSSNNTCEFVHPLLLPLPNVEWVFRALLFKAFAIKTRTSSKLPISPVRSGFSDHNYHWKTT